MHKKCLVRYKCATSAKKLSACAVNVAAADPAIPNRGIGPHPKINRGLSATSSTTDMERYTNGVLESPAPRSAAMRKNKPPMKGSARKMMRMYVSASGRESG